jgi:signal transduction histidine kinase
MKERIAILGGTLDVEGKPGEGTALAIQIPLGPSPRG